MTTDSADFIGQRLLTKTSGGLRVLTLAASLLTGCPVAEADQKGAVLAQPVSPGHVSARVVTNSPSQPHRFSTWRKMNPVWWFGNADEPLAPEWYRPGKRGRNFMWHLRNPCHNFDNYVIGVADKPFRRAGRYPEAISNPHGGWNWAVCRYKWLRLPFIAYDRGRFHFYCGWRERGNFGIKLNFSQGKEASARKPEQPPPHPGTKL